MTKKNEFLQRFHSAGKNYLLSKFVLFVFLLLLYVVGNFYGSKDPTHVLWIMQNICWC